MTLIKLVDARRNLNLKCRELFADEKIAEAIYRYLCDGIEECEEVEPEDRLVMNVTLSEEQLKEVIEKAKGESVFVIAPNPKKGKWICVRSPHRSDGIVCSECGYDSMAEYPYCPRCGCRMERWQDETD